MDRVVVSIGGSVLIPEKDDAKYIKALADMLRDVSKEVEIMVVCGGGKVSRYYSKTGKELGGTTYQLDELGIGVTKVNAKLLDIALGDAGIGKVPQTAEECASERHIGKVPVMGGTEPGHTTDAVAAMIAKACDADRIVNASNVDAVYTDDPRTNPNAKMLDKITTNVKLTPEWIFAFALERMPQYSFRYLLRDGDSNFKTYWRQSHKKYTKALSNMLDDYIKLES